MAATCFVVHLQQKHTEVTWIHAIKTSATSDSHWCLASMWTPMSVGAASPETKTSIGNKEARNSGTLKS